MVGLVPAIHVCATSGPGEDVDARRKGEHDGAERTTLQNNAIVEPLAKGRSLLTLFIQQVLNGLLDGVYYLLIALGLSLIFSLGGIVNLAHGAFYAIGAYLMVEIGNRLGFAPAFVIAPVLVARALSVSSN